MAAKQHQLAAWIDSHTTRVAFAKKAGCSESHLSLILSGDRGLSYELAKRMSRATHDEVPLERIFAETERVREYAEKQQRASA